MSHTVDSAQHTIHFERRLAASPADVFDAWTQAEQLTHWWDPSGTPLSACTVDLRPGGSFRLVTVGHAPPFEGRYVTIDRPGLLVFEAMGAVGTVALRQDGDGTHMQVAIRCASAEHFEMFVQLGVHTGTAVTLDNLVARMAARAAR